MRSIVILQTARLGDLVQTTYLLRRARKEHPGAHITLVAQESCTAILDGGSYCDSLVALPAAAFESLAETSHQEAFPALAPFDLHPVFRSHHDLLVNVGNDLASAVLCDRIPAARKLGRVHTYEGELRLLGPWAKYLFAMVSHREDNQFNLVDIQSGLAGFVPRPEPPALEVPEARRADARMLLTAHGRRPGRKMVAIQAGASGMQRAWSMENFAALARALRAGIDADILLVGDARERERTEQLAVMIAEDGLPGPILNLAGRTSLKLLPATLAECDLLVSNDTGTIHVAAAVGAPALGLYFSTAWYSETAPYGAGHAVLQVEIPCAPCSVASPCPVQRCREFLPPEAVSATAVWMLRGASASEPPPAFPNLRLYRSRFLDNGSLAYQPVHATQVSESFQAGMLGRLMWESVLGLDRDSGMEAAWRGYSAGAGTIARRAALASALATLEAPIRQGVDIAGKLRAEFEADIPVREHIVGLHENLSTLGASLAAASRPAGTCGRFLHYEMMDMDYATYPMLAEILEGKYRMLAEWIGRFRATLARLDA